MTPRGPRALSPPAVGHGDGWEGGIGGRRPRGREASGRRGAPQSRPSPARVVAAVRVLQISDRQAQVTLGRGEAFVAEHFLDVAHVGAVLQEVRGAGVAPQVRRHFFLHARRLGVAADQVGEGVIPEAKAVAGVVDGRDEEPGRAAWGFGDVAPASGLRGRCARVRASA